MDNEVKREIRKLKRKAPKFLRNNDFALSPEEHEENKNGRLTIERERKSSGRRSFIPSPAFPSSPRAPNLDMSYYEERGHYIRDSSRVLSSAEYEDNK